MGYHLIITNDNGEIESHYAENINDFVEFSNINEKSIIYQGEKDWKPIVIGKDKKYINLVEEKFRAGIKAEKLFKKQAIEHGLMVEDLSQDPESFKAYKSNSKAGIKRGDYLIRNARNLEIEVKCFSYYFINKKEYIYFSLEQYYKHLNMKKFTGSPIIIAFYKRDKDTPIKDSLKMIDLQTIQEELYKKVFVDKEEKVLKIPIYLTKEKFTLIDDIKKEINENSDIII